MYDKTFGCFFDYENQLSIIGFKLLKVTSQNIFEGTSQQKISVNPNVALKSSEGESIHRHRYVQGNNPSSFNELKCFVNHIVP